MSRIIKFRVWDKKNNRMFNDCFELTKKGYMEWVQLKQASDNLEWMQFTGLSDKNGKDVFEGDLIKWAIGGGIVQEVYWNTKECAFYARPFSMDNTESWLDSSCEVIGNIHENPELLK